MWKKWIIWVDEYKADKITEDMIQNELKVGKCFWHG